MSQTLTRASFFSSEVIVYGDLAASSKHTVTALGSNNTLHASNFHKAKIKTCKNEPQNCPAAKVYCKTTAPSCNLACLEIQDGIRTISLLSCVL